ncbi:MAG: hypothetical protein WCK74_02970 [Gemmatimonadaceae bacterium]|jgi:hypothetical protein
MTTLFLPGPVADMLFWAAVVACALAQLFIVRAVWRVLPPVPAPDGADAQVPAPRRAQEMAWALLPALLMALLFVGAWRQMHPTPSSSPIPSPLPETPAVRA